MAKRRYTYGYMVYGCDSCRQGFEMQIEAGLEGTPATSGLKHHIPTPFFVTCPLCGQHSTCHDVSGLIRYAERRRLATHKAHFALPKYDPNLTENQISDQNICGEPVFPKNVKPEYKLRPPDPNQPTPEQLREIERKTIEEGRKFVTDPSKYINNLGEKDVPAKKKAT